MLTHSDPLGNLGAPLAAAFGCAKDVPPEISLERCASIIRDWIADCRELHEGCAGAVEGHGMADLPSRLIDVGERQGASVVLVESQDNETCRNHQYATLSHCWGKAPVIQTTKATLTQRKRCIGWQLLPKPFQDAITIVRALGIRFIWIDSLCIVQDDELDWKQESVRMAAIYSNGYVNIAVTGASDSRGGCLSRQSLKHTSRMLDIGSFLINTNADRKLPFIFVRPSFDPIHHRYSTGSSYESDLPDSNVVPLLSRAWVFQERYLAPRTLHFHPSEMVMECKSSLYCECTGLDKVASKSRRNSFDLKTSDRQRIFNSWFQVVEEFSRLHLSRESDRLPALTGVATVFQRRLKLGTWRGYGKMT